MLAQEPTPVSRGVMAETPQLWGLSARALHDAYWRSFGVQCLRAGSTVAPDRAADLFLLLGADDLVRFDIRELSSHLLWVGAALTRLRIVDREPEHYRERVEVDESGFVERIERIYRPRTTALCRVVLTRRPRLARAWVHPTSLRVAWRRVHRLAGRNEVDYYRCTGRCFNASHAEEQRRFLSHLVGVWDRPDRSILGVSEVEPGVWSQSDQRIPDSSRLVGPLWIGREAAPITDTCVVGPACLLDGESSNGHTASAQLRPIGEIEPGGASTEDPVAAPPQPGYAAAKRIVDLVASLFGLTLLSPAIALIAIAITIDDGWPVFYGHVRQSRGGRLFRCWKFRTMRAGADRLTRQLQEQNACDGPQFYIEHDPRVTRVGRVLRKYHLDELPQLWNVLRGHMSLVGPRPSPDSENQICAPWRDLRLSVRPGITGLWQIKRTRRPGLDFQEWIQYDVEYVRTAGFWQDTKILLTTLRNVLFKMLRLS